MTNDEKGIPGWAIALLIAAAIVPLLGIASALAIYGVRRYVVNAKSAEGRANVSVLAAGIARCASSSGSLPATSAAVPRSLAAVAGMKYLAAPAEWADPSLTCAGFSLRDSQYFQYQWVLLGPSQGEARARADLDGDGVPELSLVTQVECSAGSCAVGPAVEAGAGGASSRGARASKARPSGPSPSGADAEPPLVALALIGVYVVVSSLCGIWGIVIAFQESLMWGLLSLFVPCAHIVFVIKFWERAKKPFLIQLAALPLLFVAVVVGAVSDARAKRAAPSVAVDDSVEEAPTPSKAAPPKVTGSPVDLSTVMGRARALADAWQPEAALCGIDAIISQGLIQTGEGGTATLVFGPSPFGKPGARTGSFVVTYDASGIHGAPSAEPAGKPLTEPMCAPETAYHRATASSGARVRLRYALDSRGKNPVWLCNDAGDGTLSPSAFDAQRCAAAAR